MMKNTQENEATKLGEEVEGKKKTATPGMANSDQVKLKSDYQYTRLLTKNTIAKVSGEPANDNENGGGEQSPPPSGESTSTEIKEYSNLFNFILSKTDHYIEFRVLGLDEQIKDRLWSRDMDEISTFIDKYNGIHHILFGVVPREHGGGKKEYCREVPWLWVDIDFKDFDGGETEAREILSTFPYSPSAIVHSGGGLHCYWILKEQLNAKSDMAQVEKALKRLASGLGADRNRAEIASCLRVPGTMNMKPKYKGALCRLETFDPCNRISLEDVSSHKFANESKKVFDDPDVKGYEGAIIDGNRDNGAMAYVNSMVKKYGSDTDDEALYQKVILLLDKAGGDNLDAIKNKVRGWIETAHPLFDNGRKLTTLQLAETIVQELGEHVIYTDQGLRRYLNGHWPLIEDKPIRKRIAELDRPNTKTNRTNDALQILKDLKSSEEMTAQMNLICLQNGTLDPINGELLSHSPDHQLLNQLPVEWNPDTKCKLWIQTLNEVFENDSDRSEKIQFLQEWFGYCLIPETNQHKMVWMVGAGANGKSLILEILSAIVGEENVSNIMLTGFSDGHTRVGLVDKLVNISAEMNANATISDSYVKAIVSGDRIEANPKFKTIFFFKPFTRLISATNELPRLLDLSGGFQRRLIILNFNRVFSEAEQDKKLPEKLKEELSGIFAWAVQGLQRLIEQGAFAVPPSSKEAVGQYITESDPVRQFAEERLLADESGSLTATMIYGVYKDYAESRGYQKMNVGTFGKRLKALGFKKRNSNGNKYFKIKLKRAIIFNKIQPDEDVCPN